MKTLSFEFEGVSYTIRRLTHDEVSDLVAEKDRGTANKKALAWSLVEPPLALEDVGGYDGAHTAVILQKINEFSFLPVARAFDSAAPSS